MQLQTPSPTEQQERPTEREAQAPKPGVGVRLSRHRAFLSALAFFVLMLAAFVITSPDVFLNAGIYGAVFSSSLPLVLIVVVPLVFVVVSGEIDLSFPSLVGLTAYVFAEAFNQGLDPFVSFLLAIAVGAFAGLVNGWIVAYVGLPSLVVTLGMMFLVRGLVQVLAGGNAISLGELRGSTFEQVFIGDWGPLPGSMAWALVLAGLGLALFGAHKFGAHIRAIGDNAAAAHQMGIKVRRTKLLAFVYLGVASAIAGVFSVTINSNFYPTTGDGLLLLVLAAVFVGGTPVWGGTGTIAGAIIGAATVGFIETGVVSAGLTGNYTQLFYGLVILLSLVAHRVSNRGALTR
jgi:ribose/xylose/arabinose/galactoside ABC-type transport system permease subunit